ncbi:MAG: response regulator transcription factor [Enterocloster sp.]
MARILIVDDEPDIHRLICRYAQREGYETMEASDGTEAVKLCREHDFDIIIMDVMMPDMDGFTACREIKKMKDIPVLMLSARGAEYDRLLGFDLGIDDYVVKPFSPRELMARINVIVKRHSQKTAGTEPGKGQIEIGALRIDTLGRNVYVEGEKTELTAKEYDLLIYFAENTGIVLSREKLLNAVWGYEYQGEDRTVDWQIKLLRSKLGNCRNYIVTVRGVGYKFEKTF